MEFKAPPLQICLAQVKNPLAVIQLGGNYPFHCMRRLCRMKVIVADTSLAVAATTGLLIMKVGFQKEAGVTSFTQAHLPAMTSRNFGMG